MPPISNMIRPFTTTVLLAFSGAVFAHNANSQDTGKHFKPSVKILPMSEAERTAELARRRQVLNNTQNIFTLLGAEIALNRGESAVALNTYLAVLHRTKDPEVAERAMELAVSIRAYDVAERVYDLWKKLEPKPSPAQRRIAWTRALALGDVGQVARHLEDVVKEANEEQAQRIFLLLAQVGSENHALAKAVVKPLRKAAERYPDMTEALIASALFDSITGDTRRAISDLQKLADTDTQLNPATRLALGMIVRDNPKLLPEFFQQTDTSKLSPIWQELEIESLIQDKQYEAAYERLQKLLENNTDADLYIQAAVLSYQHKKNVQTTLNYLEKAHQIGTQTQKSRAAVLAAIRLLTEHRFEECAMWIKRITSSEMAFDKLVLQVSVAAERQQWREALRLARQRSKLSSQQSRFFTDNDLQQLQLFALVQSNNNPQQSVNELNRIINQAKRQQGSDDILATALYQRGLLYSDKLKRFQLAVNDFRQYLVLKPDDVQGMNALGYTLLEKAEHLDEAYQLIRKAYLQDPESGQINDSMGWAYFKKGDPKAALPYLQYAYQQDPDPEVASHLGETYWALGLKDQAREVWKEAWQKNRQHRVLIHTLRKYGVRF